EGPARAPGAAAAPGQRLAGAAAPLRERREGGEHPLAAVMPLRAGRWVVHARHRSQQLDAPHAFHPSISLWGQIDRHTALPDRREYLETFHAFSPDLLLVAESGGRLVGTIIRGRDRRAATLGGLSRHPRGCP